MTERLMNHNPYPVPEGNHPLLDAVIDLGRMRGTTIRQMREMAQRLLDEGPGTAVEGGLATGVVTLVGVIEDLTEPLLEADDHDVAPCRASGSHRTTQRHRWTECPAVRDVPLDD